MDVPTPSPAMSEFVEPTSLHAILLNTGVCKKDDVQSSGLPERHYVEMASRLNSVKSFTSGGVDSFCFWFSFAAPLECGKFVDKLEGMRGNISMR